MTKDVLDKKAFTADIPIAGTLAAGRASFILQFLQVEKQKQVQVTDVTELLAHFLLV